jgi:hypothetical protein
VQIWISALSKCHHPVIIMTKIISIPMVESFTLLCTRAILGFKQPSHGSIYVQRRKEIRVTKYEYEYMMSVADSEYDK